jgi:regulatory protein
MDLLARREHSRYELAEKLRQRFSDRDDDGDEGDEGDERFHLESVLPRVLDQLEHDGLLSDERFVESYVRVRRNKGYGPLHIRQNLQQRRVASGLIEIWVDDQSSQWQQQLAMVLHKRCGATLPVIGSREYFKLQRFLQSRGFTGEQIRRAFRCE